MDGSAAASVVYETLAAIFAPTLPGTGAIMSPPGGRAVVPTRSFDVRHSRSVSTPVPLPEAVRALVFGRPRDIQRLIRGLRTYFDVTDEGHRDIGSGEEERELRIDPNG
ncbi:hypothetical protein [Streptomyces sp. ISL-1]|uniref:hypothetical protein n=1 Tax=unclassified Streptomyces TaxID=2593676 RepID=UPI001BEB7FDA|nr:hypothetical protein [Streptomyces sp. ISL-1]MBT2388575.1 hypothetical protein [Streptomyces sp. ISL-1]